MRVIVMAKAPVAGYAKTRLVPALGAEGAAALAARLLDAAVAQALASGVGPVELCVAPDPVHPAFQAWAGRVDVVAQGEGDLGARMARAFERALAGGGPVLMIGTDAPALDAAVLRQAAAALDEADAVVVPALDGGYVLIGLRRMRPELFVDMPWSTDQVARLTRERLDEAGARSRWLPALADVDEPADLVHVPPSWRPASPGTAGA